MRTRHQCEEELPLCGTISLVDPAERARWAKAFDVSESVLKKAVQIVGPAVRDLRKLFCEH